MTQDWIEQANCNGMDTKYFTLGLLNSDGVPIEWLERTAKQVCTSCPVKVQCLESASKADLMWTIRGGKIPVSTKALKIPSAADDVQKFMTVNSGKCRSRSTPHDLLSTDDVLVYLDTNRGKGYRIRCRACTEQARLISDHAMIDA